MGVLAWQPARADMFRVAANMNETYYGEYVQQRKTNLDAPRVTINNHRMTNVQSRLPDQPMGGMQMQMQDAYAANDELTRIKMRNRRFQQSVAADQGLYGPPMLPAQLRGQPWMQQGPPMPPMQMEMGGMCDELAMIAQALNMTRRATRPFVPQADPAFNDLQRQVQLLETLPAAPIRPTRVNIDELLSTDSLPAPAPAPAPKQRQVGIADQIAIRSYVLGKGLAK